jgi:hypothetical protein
MINNSSADRWIRLESKSLDQQFLNEIVHGLNCSPFEASAVLDTVYNVFGNYFDSGASLKPGRIRLQVLSIEAKISQSISESKQISVILTLHDDKEDLSIRKQDGVIGLRRHKIRRVCQEAFDQGGLLTVEDLAYRLFNCGVKTICRDLVYFRKNDIFVPLRSTVKDVGRTLSHRLLIIKLWAQGKEYSEISLNASHSLSAVQNYIDKFKRTVALVKEGYDINRISFLLRISTSLVEQYVNLYHRLDFADHREKELSSFLKKSFISNNQETNS